MSKALERPQKWRPPEHYALIKDASRIKFQPKDRMSPLKTEGKL
ncbi:hypothetical protein [Crocosphaera sp. XPORK-15E]|nr:hypothetical protein [Crocosphaera sp. XPORK-15E]MEA5536901.1 hypothetical protein [Crocosphaera sp. XPORK-15E]